MSKIEIQDFINWCDKNSEEGNEVILFWDGGGGSKHSVVIANGYGPIRKIPETLPFIKLLKQRGYFSWTDEFNVYGDATYDASSRSFVGIDHRFEVESKEGISTTVESNIEIWLPINTQFNTLIIKTEGHYCKVEVKIARLDGSAEPKYKRIENMLEILISEQLYSKFGNSATYILNFDHTYEIPRESFIEAAGVLLYYIKTIGYSKKIITESKVEIDLTKILNDV